MFSAAPDAEAILREYRRAQQPAQASVREGRTLGGAAGPSAAVADVNDVMARMEARVAQLGIEVATEQHAARNAGHVRGGCATRAPAQPASRPAAVSKRPSGEASGGLAELSRLEGEAKASTQQAEWLRLRLAELEQQCAAAGLQLDGAEPPELVLSVGAGSVSVDATREARGGDLAAVIARYRAAGWEGLVGSRGIDWLGSCRVAPEHVVRQGRGMNLPLPSLK